MGAISSDVEDQDTLYIFKMSLITDVTFERLESGCCVIKYRTSLGRSFLSATTFEDIFEALVYYSDIVNCILDGGHMLTIRYWREKYPDFARYEIIRFHDQEYTPSLALTGGKLKLSSLV
jgi:hypothetical protein